MHIRGVYIYGDFDTPTHQPTSMYVACVYIAMTKGQFNSLPCIHIHVPLLEVQTCMYEVFEQCLIVNQFCITP